MTQLEEKRIKTGENILTILDWKRQNTSKKLYNELAYVISKTLNSPVKAFIFNNSEDYIKVVTHKFTKFQVKAIKNINNVRHSLSLTMTEINDWIEKPALDLSLMSYGRNHKEEKMDFTMSIATTNYEKEIIGTYKTSKSWIPSVLIGNTEYVRKLRFYYDGDCYLQDKFTIKSNKKMMSRTNPITLSHQHFLVEKRQLGDLVLTKRLQSK